MVSHKAACKSPLALVLITLLVFVMSSIEGSKLGYVYIGNVYMQIFCSMQPARVTKVTREA